MATTPARTSLKRSGKKKRSKRYYRRKALRILIVAGVPLLLFGLVFSLWRLVWIPHRQAVEKARLESISISESIARQQQYQEDLHAIQSASAEALSQEVLDALKTQALDSYVIREDGEIARNEQTQPAGDQALYFLQNLSGYDSDILSFYLDNPERFEFVKAFPERERLQSAPETLNESLESVPHLLQWDTRWGYEPYGDSTMYYAGCAPTSLAMVLSYLKQDPSITPEVIKRYSEENGYYVSGAGTSHDLLDDYPLMAGVDVERIVPDQASVSEALGQGKILIFNMTPGIFTRVGHFMVVSAEENGQLRVLDPNSLWRSKLWNYDDVLSTTMAVWALSPVQDLGSV